MGLLKNLRAYYTILTRTRYDRVPDIARLLVRRPAIMAAVGAYETALMFSAKVDGRLKALGEMKISSLIGCPF